MLERVKIMMTRTIERFGFANVKSFASLFAAAQDAILFRDKLTKPYAQVPSVYKAVKALCDNVPQAELVIRDWKTQEESESPQAKEIMALLDKPNAKQSQADFIQELVGFYALYGEVLILKRQSIGQAAGTRNLPAEIEAFNPEGVTKIKDAAGNILKYRIANTEYPAEQVIQIKDFNPYDKNSATRPNDPLNNLIETDWLTAVYNKAFFDNNAAPPFALSSDKPLTEVQRARIEKWLREEHGGARNAHKTPVLESGMKPIPFGATHKDMDFLEQKKFTREEILGNWRVPKALFNITDDLNYATFQGQMKVFWLYGIMPICRKIEDALTRNLLMPYAPGLYLEFDTKNVPAFQEDAGSKADTAAKYFAMGVPLNQINEKLDMGFEDVPWGDTWWVPFGLHPADEPLDFTDPAAAPAGTAATEETKGVAKLDPVKFRKWKSFLEKQTPIEKRLERVIARFFFEQRGRVLASLYKNGEKSIQTKAALSISMDWSKETLDLIEKVTPYLYKAMTDGLDSAESTLPNLGADMDLLRSMVITNSGERAKRMRHVTDTMKRRLGSTIDAGLQAGEAVDKIAERIRREYNVASGRSLLIARTETTGAVNDGSLLYYDKVGIKEVEWITAHDENVRQSHRDCEDAGAKKIGSVFPNGLRYPGDPLGDVGEVANCRCTLSPVA